MVGEVLVVTNSKEQTDLYAKIVSSSNVRFVVGFEEMKGSLSAVLTGFEAAQGKYALLLPFDGPFVSKEVVSLFFDCCVGKSAVIPRWPDRQIEPLQAVYCTELALEAAKEAFASGELDLDAMVCKMRGVRYLSTLVVEQLDPEFQSFFRVKSPLDLKKAIMMSKPRKTKRRQ
jgi:molybdopterin-guanine dinucleotide biosynthesis protein A